MKLVRRPEVVTAVLQSSRYIELNLVTFLSRDASVQMLCTIRSNYCLDPDAWGYENDFEARFQGHTELIKF